MKKTLSVFLGLPLLIIILSGCWDKTELNELSIITAFGIDKTEKGYLVSVQVVNTGEIAGKTNSGRTEVVTFMGSGDTISHAMRKMSKDGPRKAYLAHLREVVFGEEMAREGIGKTLDNLSRYHEVRSDFYLTVAKGSQASDILTVTTALEKIPAKKIFGALENSENTWGTTKIVQLDELITSILSKGKEPALMGVYVYGKHDSGSEFTNVQTIKPKTGLRIDSVAVFKKDKLLGWLGEEESRGYNYIVDNIKHTVENVDCEGGKLSLNTIRSQTKLTGKVVNGKPEIEMTVNSEGDIGDVECNIDVATPEVIKELEGKYANQIKQTIEAAINKVQEEYQSDIFGFGEVIHRKDPKAWKRLAPNWDQEFANLEVNVHVKTKIHRLGTIKNSIQKEIED